MARPTHSPNRNALVEFISIDGSGLLHLCLFGMGCALIYLDQPVVGSVGLVLGGLGSVFAFIRSYRPRVPRAGPAQDDQPRS
jgi:hypothetical protein